MRVVDSVLAATSRIASIAAGTGIFILMLLTVTDGIQRTLFGRGIPGSVEITEVFLVILVFAGMLGAEVTDSHISTSIVTDQLPARARRGARLIGTTISFLGASLFAYASAAPALRSVAIQEVEFGLIRIPIYPAKIFIFLGFVLLAVAILCGILRQILDLRHDPDGTASSEEGVPATAFAATGGPFDGAPEMATSPDATQPAAQHNEKVLHHEY
ncbi:TRAP transporter small permease subunit [Arthrobacter sp. B6]|uniref:TRAP transporter small permease subunit n=1 Tax=Arthrobacter sp. B6 TaxID=1570137 RepID=UPI00082E6CF1|nr:TRAP transporter small permease [Arthrobacter sp. B6]